MANDADWVDDVRRWYFGGHPPQGECAGEGPGGRDEHAIGFEAAGDDSHGSSWSDRMVAGSP